MPYQFMGKVRLIYPNVDKRKNGICHSIQIYRIVLESVRLKFVMHYV